MTVMWGTEGRPAIRGEAGAGWPPIGNKLELLLATGSIDLFNTLNKQIRIDFFKSIRHKT